jgi:hypothetical protein
MADALYGTPNSLIGELWGVKTASGWPMLIFTDRVWNNVDRQG